MAESSLFWTDSTGDGGPYNQSDLSAWLEHLFTTDNDDTEGVLKGDGNELAVTGTSSPVAVGTGAAIVKGRFYLNTASVNVSVPTPSSNTRIDRIVLQADWTAQTVRIARVAGSEGGAAPALTQTDGTKWEISLAQASITTGGVITVTDERVFCQFGTRVTAAMIDAAVAGDGLAGGAGTALSVNVDDATIEISGDTLQVKDAGIDADALAASVAGDGLSGGAGTALSVGVDDSTIEISGDALQIKDDAVTADKLAHSIDATGIGFNADQVDGYEASELLDGGVPIGSIIMWYGSLGGAGNKYPMIGGSPDTNWQLCDGTNGTPDMQGRFPLGAGGSVGAAKGDTGGRETWNWSHAHGGGNLQTGGTSTQIMVEDGSGPNPVTNNLHQHNVTAGNTANNGSASESLMPPYRALYFLQKVA